MPAWTGKSRGTLIGYQILIFLLKSLGLRFTYLSLHFISYYYFLFAGDPKRHIIQFYQIQLGYSLRESKRLCRQNFYIFAQSLIDRVAISANIGKAITYTQQGEEQLVAWSKNGNGGFLLSAHVGNWAVAGYLLKALDAKVNVLLVDNEVQSLQKFLDSQKKAPQYNIIPIKKDLSHLIEIFAAIKRGEFVCVNADRFLPGSKTIEIDFLAGKAHFPEGIFSLIAKLKVPYAFDFAIKSGTFSYHFSSTMAATNTDALQIAKTYVEALQDVVKQHPEQWFNYYDFYANNA